MSRTRRNELEKAVGYLLDMGVRIHMPKDFDAMSPERKEKYRELEVLRDAQKQPPAVKRYAMHDVALPDVHDDEDIERFRREVRDAADADWAEEQALWDKDHKDAHESP